MNSIVIEAIEAVKASQISFSKYITANDVGATGGHQSGFHIHKKAWPLFFSNEGIKGTNKDKFITIKWQNDFETTSRVIYYGVGTRNEYRLTRFGKSFPFLNDDNIGDLLVITKVEEYYYNAFVLSTDEEIEYFLNSVNISTKDINGIIPKPDSIFPHNLLYSCFKKYIESLNCEFPPSIELSKNARDCYNRIANVKINHIITNPDEIILNWLDSEFKLFHLIENDRYSKFLSTPFSSIDLLIETANTILNRRKSRAGKSLEHNLSEIFTSFNLSYETQAITENNKKPDFIFPNQSAYWDVRFNENKLFVLACKTTCKDRWRQVLNEADRVRIKHLFTLQQGISKNQLEEMYKYGVCLVVPQSYIPSFPKEYREKILSLYSFVQHVKSTQH